MLTRSLVDNIAKMHISYIDDKFYFISTRRC